MINLTITHITPHACEMLKQIWDCKTVEELHSYQLGLEPDDLRLSISLCQLLQYEYIDSEQAKTGDLQLAQSVINCVK
jgi:hypothetical protein